MAISGYDHVRDIADGSVPVDGVDLTCLQMRVEEIFFRFVHHREWHVSELSLAKFTTMRERDAGVVGIPVFPSREFRHSSFYVRADSPAHALANLAGKTVGVPEWTMTATVYARGLLSDAGVPLESIDWVQAGLDQPGRVEGVSLTLPAGLRYTSMPERTLTDLLLAGEIDAVISARSPGNGRDARIRSLLADPLAASQEHFRATRVFPIMHVVALRADVYAEHQWVAMNLLEAFEAAKRRSLERALDTACSWFPIPWSAEHARGLLSDFGQDLWPYGIEPNRITLETFLRYAAEQRVTSRRLSPAELFVPEVQTSYRV
jgi:4,5-dihydroxyphthalate decarboxylase